MDAASGTVLSLQGHRAQALPLHPAETLLNITLSISRRLPEQLGNNFVSLLPK